MCGNVKPISGCWEGWGRKRDNKTQQNVCNIDVFIILTG